MYAIRSYYADRDDEQRSQPGNDDAAMPVAAKADRQRNNADRDDDDQHLHMEMISYNFV